MNLLKTAVAGAVVLAAAAAHAGPVVTNSTSATALANAIAGSGVTISNAVFTTNGAQAGTFTGGLDTVGFGSGIVLTTGSTTCIPGPNTVSNCSGGGTTSSLSFDFTSTTGQVFFQYVFASEEYNEYVGSGFNDSFQLLLDGVNIALVPGGGGPVTVNNVNCTSNAAYYRSNSSGPAGCTNNGLDIQYDGLTTVLTASATLTAGMHSFQFVIADVGDAAWDSGVFVRAGSFSGTNDVPEPSSLALVGLALMGAAARRRKA